MEGEASEGLGPVPVSSLDQLLSKPSGRSLLLYAICPTIVLLISLLGSLIARLGSRWSLVNAARRDILEEEDIARYAEDKEIRNQRRRVGRDGDGIDNGNGNGIGNGNGVGLGNGKYTNGGGKSSGATSKPSSVPTGHGDEEMKPLLLGDAAERKRSMARRSAALAGLTVAGMALWLAKATYESIASKDHDDGGIARVTAGMAFLAWTTVMVWTVGRLDDPPLAILLLLVISQLAAALVSSRGVFDLVILSLCLLLLHVLWGYPLGHGLGRPSGRTDSCGPSLEDTATLGQWITFSWLNPIIQDGATRDLKSEDLTDIPAGSQAEPLLEQFQRIPGSLLYRIVRANMYDLSRDMGLTVLSSILEFAPPFFLKRILQAVEDKRPDYMLAVYALIAAIAKAQLDLQHLYNSRRAAIRIRSELSSSIYRKAMLRKAFHNPPDGGNTGSSSSSSKKKAAQGSSTDESDSPADLGKIVSLMASDAQRISITAASEYFSYSSVVQMIVAGFFLYDLLGNSAFVGFTTLIIASPAQSILVRRIMKVTKQLSAARDRRLSKLAETWSAIRFIRYFALEPEWTRRLLELREKEMGFLKTRQDLSAFNSLTWAIVPSLVSCLCFTSYILTGHQLTPVIAFPAIAVIGLLRNALNLLPMQINENLSTKVAVDRIQEYLENDEVSSEMSSLTAAPRSLAAEPDETLGFEGATIAWTSPPPAPDGAATPAEPFKLVDLDVIFPAGKLSVIAGPTACGKSSLLLGLLGEMELQSGRILLPKHKDVLRPNGMRSTVAYCAQQPWIQHATVRDNILFGSPFESERYNAVLEYCALRPDLALMPASDLTEIGEKGISLSGGQKARVALARAVYARSQFVLLDSPLSAVDAETATKLVRECLGLLIKERRTVILVTHHTDLVLSSLPVEMVVTMQEGRITAKGSPSDVALAGEIQAVEAKEARGQTKSKDVPASNAESTTAGADAAMPEEGRLVEAEKQATGATKLSTFVAFMRAARWSMIILVVAVLVARQATDSGEKFYLSFWGNSYRVVDDGPSNVLGWPPASENATPYLLGFVALQVVSASFGLTSTLGAQKASRNAGRALFIQALDVTLRATSRFVDSTPSGRVLNTFSRDIQVIDESASNSLRSTATYVISLLISITVVLYTLPAMVLPSLLLAYLNFRIARSYVRAARSLRRIEASSRSPIFSAFAELLNGIVTVRAACVEDAFLDVFFQRLDKSLSAWSLFWSANRWCLVRLDWLGALALFCSSLVALAGGIPAGLAGVALTTIQTTVMSCYWLSRLSTNLEQGANSIERVLTLIDTTPQEPAAIIENNRPPANWPAEGSIQVKDLSLRYAPHLEPVLKGITFDIKGGEKIGVVGRTGSGKSTLALAFFRFVEFEGGSITIDGVDISKIGLRDLRSRLTIIPQDAVLFAGTLRENLDPLSEHTDSDMYEALRSVQIKTSPGVSRAVSREPSRPGSIIINHDGTAASTDANGQEQDGAASEEGETAVQSYLTLDTAIIEGGQNLSQGQRQLVAMARALLRRSKIIICDEASSSVDLASDRAVQHVLRSGFKQATVITIAHRLATVVRSDKVLVLSAGRIVQFDSPSNLLKDEKGAFFNLCRQSGDWEELKRFARGPIGEGADTP